jgi:hypothetical protein
MFQKAAKGKGHGRIALLGPAGAGKSFWGLILVTELAKAENKRVAAVCSEHGSLAKYSDEFDFDFMTLHSYEPEHYMAAIDNAVQEGYGAILLDGISQAWAGKGGILEFVDQEKQRSKTKDAYGAGWGKATPRHTAFIERMLACEEQIHLVVTMRTKMEFVREEVGGKTQIRKVGMQPIQRDGLEYEFDVVGDLDQGDNVFTVSKSRCRALNVAPWNRVAKPDEAVKLAQTYIAWLHTGTTEPKPLAKAPAAAKPAAAPESDSLPKTGNGECISHAERMALTNACKAKGVTRDQFVEIIKSECGGVTDSAQIPRSRLMAVLARVAPDEMKTAAKAGLEPQPEAQVGAAA